MALTKAYTARDSAEAQFVCNLLRTEGIAAVVVGEQLESLAGAVPFGSTLPTVCVNKRDADQAAKVVAGMVDRLAQRRSAPPASRWRCPNCGEEHEPQFSECWNCRRSRPGSDADLETGGTDPAQPTTSLDELTMERGLPCTSCGYDLRGLPATHGCPECGYPVVGSVLEALTQDDLTDPAELDHLVRAPFETVARQTGFPVEAVLVIGHAWLRALLPMESRMPDDPIDPARLRDLVRDYAISHFGDRDEARELFQRWGILGGQQIAQIGAALLDAGLLPPGTPVDPAALRGRFAVNDLFAANP